MARTIIPTRTRRALQADASAREFNTTISVWRTPAPSGGKTGDRVQVLSGVSAGLRTLGVAELASLAQAAPQALSGMREGWLCRVLAEVVIRPGDEIRDPDGGRYEVKGSTNSVGILRTCVLSKVLS